LPAAPSVQEAAISSGYSATDKESDMASNPAATRADLTVEDVWRRFGAEVRSFVRRRVSNPHLADDLVADILLRVHRNLGTLDDSDRVAAWLFRIARNVIIDEYRRAGDDREVLEAAPGDHVAIDTDDFADAEKVQQELANCVRPMLEYLSPEYRRALQMTDLDGVTQAAAAQEEGISVSGMKSRVQRARKQLAELFTQCCALTLDTRGFPMEYTPRANCGHDEDRNQADSGCGCH
jgi:RNA polymerase sigma-70 factor (ECF subfamily)